MNISKLDATDRLQVYGSVAVIVGAVIGGTVTSLGWIAVLAAIGMLAVVFMPQLSPSTRLPGSKGSLMVVCGGAAAVVMLLGLLTALNWYGLYFTAYPVQAIFFLGAVGGALVMGWVGWQVLQAEGGTFRIGTPQGPGA